MPNIVENELTVSGDEESINQFKDMIGGASQFSLEKILPTPQKFLEDEERSGESLTFEEGIKKGLPDWYTWRMQHWGVKWDISDCELVTDSFELPSDHYITYRFSSAWNAPLIALESLSKKIPNLKMNLHYVEIMNGIDMKVQIKGGELEIVS